MVALLAPTCKESQRAATEEEGADEGAPAAAGRSAEGIEEPGRHHHPGRTLRRGCTSEHFFPYRTRLERGRSCCLTSSLRAAPTLSSVAAATPAAATMRTKAIVELRYQRNSLSVVVAVMLLRMMMAVMADSSSRSPGGGKRGKTTCCSSCAVRRGWRASATWEDSSGSTTWDDRGD